MGFKVQPGGKQISRWLSTNMTEKLGSTEKRFQFVVKAGREPATSILFISSRSSFQAKF